MPWIKLLKNTKKWNLDLPNGIALEIHNDGVLKGEALDFIHLKQWLDVSSVPFTWKRCKDDQKEGWREINPGDWEMLHWIDYQIAMVDLENGPDVDPQIESEEAHRNRTNAWAIIIQYQIPIPVRLAKECDSLKDSGQFINSYCWEHLDRAGVNCHQIIGPERLRFINADEQISKLQFISDH